MYLTLIVIGFVILFHFMVLKGNFSVKRNQPQSATSKCRLWRIGYSRGNHRLSREIRRRIQKSFNGDALKGRTMLLLLQKKAHNCEILRPRMCPALTIYDHG